MYPLCLVSDITECAAKGFNIKETALFMVKKNGQIYVYKNSCPHQGIPLEWQPDQFLDFDKEFIQCAMHGALFTIENGECIAGPCPGDHLTIIKHSIIDGQIYIDV